MLSTGTMGGQAFLLVLCFCEEAAKQLNTFATLYFTSKKESSLGSGARGLQTYISKSLDDYLPEYFIRRLFSQNQVKASLKYRVRPGPKRRNITPWRSEQQTLSECPLCARHHVGCRGPKDNKDLIPVLQNLSELTQALGWWKLSKNRINVNIAEPLGKGDLIDVANWTSHHHSVQSFRWRVNKNLALPHLRDRWSLWNQTVQVCALLCCWTDCQIWGRLLECNFIICKNRVTNTCLTDHCEDYAKLFGQGHCSDRVLSRFPFPTQNGMKILGLCLVPGVFKHFNVTHYSNKNNWNGTLKIILEILSREYLDIVTRTKKLQNYFFQIVVIFSLTQMSNPQIIYSFKQDSVKPTLGILHTS